MSNENDQTVIILDDSNENGDKVEEIAKTEIINLEEINNNDLDNKEEKIGDEEEELTESEVEKIEEPEVKLKKIDFVYIKPISNENFGKINYLYDYCVDLFKEGFYDPKIITWMIENKDSLASVGISEDILKWLIKQDKYYKGNNIINSMTYRLAKFGRLAPKNDLVRILNEEDNSENFKYYQEDSFLAKDEDEEIRNDYNLIKQNHLEGIYKEEDLCARLTKLKGKKKKKRKVMEDKSLLGNKRVLNNNIDHPPAEVKIYTSFTDFLDDRAAIKNDCAENYKVKYNIIKELISAQRRKKKSDVNKEHIDNFEINFDQLSNFINEEFAICKILVDYETNKNKKEIKWSSIYKSLHKLSTDFKLKCPENMSQDDVTGIILSNDKYIERINSIYKKVNAFCQIIINLGNITKNNSEMLKKFTQVQQSQQDVNPSDYCDDKINSCLDKCKLSENLKDNFWVIYNKNKKCEIIAENFVEQNIQKEEQAIIEINLVEQHDIAVELSQVDNKVKENIEEEAKTEINNFQSPTSNLKNDSLPNFSNEIALKTKKDKKQTNQQSNKKLTKSKVFFSVDFNEDDF